jgi:hypothetical protein
MEIIVLVFAVLFLLIFGFRMFGYVVSMFWKLTGPIAALLLFIVFFMFLANMGIKI